MGIFLNIQNNVYLRQIEVCSSSLDYGSINKGIKCTSSDFNQTRILGIWLKASTSFRKGALLFLFKLFFVKQIDLTSCGIFLNFYAPGVF